MSVQKKIFRGFTLIELLITIAIIGVLSAAVLIGINPAKKIAQANDARVKRDIGTVAGAAQSYYTINQTYPVTGATGLTALVNSELGGTSLATTITYTSNVPASCPGTVASPCTKFSVSAVLTGGAATGDLWCYQSGSATQVASEVTSTAGCPVI